MKTYEFPEFLSEIGSADMLSNAVYKSFDTSELLIEPEKQPFEDYKCTACFSENYYIFISGENYGLLDSSGNVLIPSENVKKITPVSVDLLQIKYDDNTTAYFRTMDGSGETEVIEDFDMTRIAFVKQGYNSDSGNGNGSDDGYAIGDGNGNGEDNVDSGSSETVDTYSLQIDGNVVYDGQWTSVEQIDIDSVNTSHSCEAIYKAVSVSGTQFITFDKLYNFTVYDAPNGFVSLKIGGEYGECYILNSDDYSELETLISSFGSELRVNPPSKDENADYIRITLGLSDSVSQTLTVSSDGYCLVDKESEDGSGDRYFKVMSSETFIDLINWVDETLGKEYSSKLDISG
jgi:hypothetical protein